MEAWGSEVRVPGLRLLGLLLGLPPRAIESMVQPGPESAHQNASGKSMVSAAVYRATDRRDAWH